MKEPKRPTWRENLRFWLGVIAQLACIAVQVKQMTHWG